MRKDTSGGALPRKGRAAGEAGGAGRASGRRSPPVWLWLAALATMVLVNAVFAASSRTLGLAPLWRLSAEALVLIGLVLTVSSVRPRLSRAVEAVGAAVLLLTVVLKGASVGVYQALSRSLNLAYDWTLIRPAFDVVHGALGPTWAVALFLGLLLTLLLAWLLFTAALRAIAAVGRTPVAGGLGALGMAAGVAVAVSVWPANWREPGSPIATRLAYQQVDSAVRTLRRQSRFGALLERDPFASVARPMPLLRETDVLTVFIESYGASAIRDAPFSAIVAPRLESMERDLAAAGLRMASAWLDSPTVGGQSWLAHTSVLSGITIDNDIEHQAFLRSGRTTLIDLFERAGHRTVAVMPAIVWPWPEGERLGYDRILAAADLGYEAAPFNWVTMPDQFVLSAFERLVRDAPISERNPVFAEIALISSHAPWTPIARLLPWAEIDKAGRVFDAMAKGGPAPAEVWSDRARLREHFALSLDYALQTLGSYAAEFADEKTLLIVLGDHQPAPVVTGPGAGSLVPIHVIARDPALLAPFERQGFEPGLLPGEGAPTLPMARMRDLMLTGYGERGFGG